MKRIFENLLGIHIVFTIHDEYLILPLLSIFDAYLIIAFYVISYLILVAYASE